MRTGLNGGFFRLGSWFLAGADGFEPGFSEGDEKLDSRPLDGLLIVAVGAENGEDAVAQYDGEEVDAIVGLSPENSGQWRAKIPGASAANNGIAGFDGVRESRGFGDGDLKLLESSLRLGVIDPQETKTEQALILLDEEGGAFGEAAGRLDECDGNAGDGLLETNAASGFEERFGGVCPSFAFGFALVLAEVVLDPLGALGLELRLDAPAEAFDGGIEKRLQFRWFCGV